MKTLARWDPFRELDDFQSRLATLFGRPAAREKDDAEWMMSSEWSPLVDITEDDKEYLIKAELPEVPKEQVKVKVERGILTISGERRSEKEEKNKKFHRVERSYGSFVRSFALPEDADAEKVAAEFRDGMLRVHLPKSESAKPREIDVKIS